MIEAILSGGWKSILTALVLFLMSVLSLASIIMEAIRLRREIEAAPLDGKQPTGSWLVVKDLYERSIAAGYKGKNLSRHMQSSVAQVAQAKAGPSTILASIGANAPYVGLLGTVVGIYGALHVLGAGGTITPGEVAGPVGEALVMTALGLVVAIPAVIGFNALGQMRRRHGEMLHAYAIMLQTGSNSGAHMRAFEKQPLFRAIRKTA